jgi:hypothetical protein
MLAETKLSTNFSGWYERIFPVGFTGVTRSGDYAINVFSQLQSGGFNLLFMAVIQLQVQRNFCQNS